jgi:hypothetical protein
MLVAYGPVAQGIEQQPSKLKVAGSNPAGVANIINELWQIRHEDSSPEKGLGRTRGGQGWARTDER